jgi:hypothetical protein
VLLLLWLLLFLLELSGPAQHNSMSVNGESDLVYTISQARTCYVLFQSSIFWSSAGITDFSVRSEFES